MDEIKNEGETSSCGCDTGSCTTHQETPQEETGIMAALKKSHHNDEMALALLLAITPLVVLTFFGQVGLL